MTRGVLLELHHHRFEHREGLFLVRHQRVLLRISAQADALLEVVHRQQMVLPEPIQNAEHDDALVVAHGGSAEDLLLDVIVLADFFEDGFAQLVPGHLAHVDRAPLPIRRFVQFHAEHVIRLGEDCVHLPLVGMRLLRRVLVQNVREDRGNVVVGNQLLLVDTFHQLPAQSVHRLTLFVHHVVVFENVLAGLEVLGFHCLLRRLDALGDHAALDGHALFHAQPLQQRADPLAGKDAHQVVFEGEEEARAAGVALTAGASAELVVYAPRLVPLGAQNMQASGRDHRLVLLVGGRQMRRDCIVPRRLRGLELLAGIIEALHARPGGGCDCAFCGRHRARLRFLHQVLARHEFGVAAEQNVGAAAGHVGGDGDHAQAPGLGNDLGFLLVELRVQHNVANALALQNLGEQFRLLDRGGAYQHWLLLFMQTRDLVRHGQVFLLRGAIDHVGGLKAPHRHVGWNDDNVEFVNLVEFGRFCLGRAGHSGELLVHAEVVLEGDGGEGLVLLADGYALLCLYRLVEAVGPAAAWHQAAGELVDDDDFAFFDDILDVALVEMVRLDGHLDVVLQVPVLGVGDIADAEQLLDLFPAFVGDGDGTGFLVDHEVSGPDLGLERFDQLARLEIGDDEVDARILVRRLVGGAGDDERRAGLVDEDGVDFVDDAVIVTALHHVLQVELHVVAQIVEPELVVGAVGDVGAVGLAPLLVGEVVHDDANGKTKETINLAHPLGIAFGQVVVDGDHVNAVAGERVQIAGKCRHQGFAFAGLHFGDFAGVQHHAADQLDVEVAHRNRADARLAHYGEGLGENLLECGFLGGADCVG